jgi:hypothetical protein
METTVVMKNATPRIQMGLLSAKNQSSKNPTISNCLPIPKEAIPHYFVNPSFKTIDRPMLTAIRSDAKSSCPLLRKM